jgi:hypothetical protein
MSGEEFVELASADVLSLEQYRTFSLRIFRANFKGRRSMTREMSNPLRVYRKAIPCPSVKGSGGGAFFMRGGSGVSAANSAADLYDAGGGGPDNSPSPRAFHTFRFPHLTVEVETTPQCVQFKHELEPQSQLCLNFKTMLLLSNSSSTSNSSSGYSSPNPLLGRGVGRIQAFASVILENQLERNKSVFKRMRIADTNALMGSTGMMEPHTSSARFSVYNSAGGGGKKYKSGQQHHQEGGGGGGSLYAGYGGMLSGSSFFQGGSASDPH